LPRLRDTTLVSWSGHSGLNKEDTKNPLKTKTTPANSTTILRLKNMEGIDWVDA
jgi:hypothetical protein